MSGTAHSEQSVACASRQTGLSSVPWTQLGPLFSACQARSFVVGGSAPRTCPRPGPARWTGAPMQSEACQQRHGVGSGSMDVFILRRTTYSAADSVSGLQDRDLGSAVEEDFGTPQAGEPGPDDPDVGLFRRSGAGADRCPGLERHEKVAGTVQQVLFHTRYARCASQGGARVPPPFHVVVVRGGGVVWYARRRWPNVVSDVPGLQPTRAKRSQ